MHAVAQSLAIGPMFSTALILGLSRTRHGGRLERDARDPDRGARRARDRLRVALYARRFAGAGAVYEYLTHGAHPWLGVLTAGFFFLGMLFLGGGGIYLGARPPRRREFWRRTSPTTAPAWWLLALIGLAIVLALNHLGIRDRRSARC